MVQSFLRGVEALVVSAAVFSLLAIATSGCRKSQTPVPVSSDTKLETTNSEVTNQKTTKPVSTKPVSAKPVSTKPSLKSASNEKPKVAPHPRIGEFTEAQLGKEQTLFVIGFDSTTRHSYFIKEAGLEPHQFDALRQLVDSYDDDYQRLRNQRDRILNHAMDGEDVQTQLDNVNVEILLTSKRVWRSIYQNILNEEQKAVAMKRFNDRSEKATLGKQNKP